MGFHLAWGLGAIAPTDRRTPSPNALLAAYADPARTGRRRPQDQPELAATPAGGWYFDWLEHADPYAGDRRVPGRRDVGRVQAPALVLAGWFDVFAIGTVELLAALRSEAAVVAHRFVGGPWDHSGLPLGRRAGDRDFGPDAAVDLHSLQLAWFDQHLRGGDEVVVDKVFATGRNAWTTEAAWPPPTAPLVLHLGGDGGLHGAAPGSAEIAVAVDPADPTPGPGGAVFPWEPVLRPGAFDQRLRRERADVIAFSGDPLPQPMLVAGRPTCHLRVEADVGTCVVVTLSEATASGPAWNVADGTARMDVASGDVTVELGPLAHEFAAGSSVGLDVAFAAEARLPPLSRPLAPTLHVGGRSSSLILPGVA
jgi:putative CocE/NonD family hydrolase